MIKFIEIEDKSIWDESVSPATESNFLQSYEWGEANALAGHKILRFLIEEDQQKIGCFQAIVKDARRGRYIEIPGGPLTNLSNKTLLSDLSAELRRLAKAHKAVFIRMRPQMTSSPELIESFKATGWRSSPMHLHAEHTSILDLTPNLDELLSNMRQQTRYEIRRVEKRGVAISSDSSTELIKQFFELQSATASRQHFIPSSLVFLQSIQQAFGDRLKVYSATKNGALLNMAIAITHGEEVDYFEAASSIEARKEPGAYGIIWQIIQDAKQSGVSRLNLWGIAPDDNKNHRFSGVTTFKNGFGGDRVAYLDAHDLVVNPLLYPYSWTIEKIRKKRRKL